MSNNFLKGFEMGYSIMERYQDKRALDKVFEIESEVGDYLQTAMSGGMPEEGAYETLQEKMGSYNGALARAVSSGLMTGDDAKEALRAFNNLHNQYGATLINYATANWGLPGAEMAISNYMQSNNPGGTPDVEAVVGEDGRVSGYNVQMLDADGNPSGYPIQLDQQLLAKMQTAMAEGVMPALANNVALRQAAAEAAETEATTEAITTSTETERLQQPYAAPQAAAAADLTAAQAQGAEVAAAAGEAELPYVAPRAAAEVAGVRAGTQETLARAEGLRVDSALAPLMAQIAQQDANSRSRSVQLAEDRLGLDLMALQVEADKAGLELAGDPATAEDMLMLLAQDRGLSAIVNHPQLGLQRFLALTAKVQKRDRVPAIVAMDTVRTMFEEEVGKANSGG